MKEAARLTSFRYVQLNVLIGLLVLLLPDGSQAGVSMVSWACGDTKSPAIIAIGSYIACRVYVKTDQPSATITVNYGNGATTMTAYPPTNTIGSSLPSSGSSYTLNSGAYQKFILKHLTGGSGFKLVNVTYFGLVSGQSVKIGIVTLGCNSTCPNNTATSASWGSYVSFTTALGAQTPSIGTELDICSSGCYVYYEGPANAISQKIDSNYDMYYDGSAVRALMNGSSTIRFDIQIDVRNETYRTYINTNVSYSNFQNYTMMAESGGWNTGFDVFVFPDAYINVVCPEQDIIVATPTYCIVTVSRPVTYDTAVLTYASYYNTGELKEELPGLNMTYSTIGPYTYYNDTFTIYGIMPWLPGKTWLKVGLKTLAYAAGGTTIYPRQDVWYEYYCDKSAAVYQVVNCSLYVTSERTYVLFYYSVYLDPTNLQYYSLEAFFDNSERIGPSLYNASRSRYYKVVPFQMMFTEDATYQVNLTMNATGLLQITYIDIYPIFKINCSTCPSTGVWGTPEDYAYNVYTINSAWTYSMIDYGDSLYANQFNCSLSVNKTYTGSNSVYSMEYYGNETFPSVPYQTNIAYLILNSEFEQEIFIEKIQFVATHVGWVNFQLINVPDCGPGVSCMDYILDVYVNLSYVDIMEHAKVLRTWRYNINTTGVNEIVVNDFSNHYPKSCFLIWWPDSASGGRIEMIDSDNLNIVDFYMILNSTTKLVALKNTTVSYVFNLAVVGQIYYIIDKCNDSRLYYYPGTFNVSYTNNSEVTTLETVTVSSRNPGGGSTCTSSLTQGQNVNCTSYYTNTTNKIQFSYISTGLGINSNGGCTATNQDTFTSAFGGSIVAGASQPSISSPSTFLLLSDVSITNAKLTSFEINAKTSGSVTIKLVRITGCVEFYSCFEKIKNSSFASLSYTQIQVYTFSVSPGYNTYNMSDSTVYDSGIIPILTTNVANLINLESSGWMRDLKINTYTSSSLTPALINGDVNIRWRLCVRVWFEKSYYSLTPTSWYQIALVYGTFNFSTVVSNCEAQPLQNYTISNQTITVTQDPNFTTTTTTAAPFQIQSIFSMSVYNTSDPATLAFLLSLLGSNYTGDLSGCLSNCSNQGLCSLNSANEYVCQCDTYYSGVKCQTDNRPCSSSPCLNDGNCTNTIDPYTGTLSLYTCDCGSYFYGTNCEYYSDLCANFSCSGHGTCKDTSSGPNCTCYLYYSGTNCQEVSPAMKAIQAVVSIASIIAIIFICSVYILLFLSDLHTAYFLNGSVLKKKPDVKPKVNKFKYKDFGQESDVESEVSISEEISHTPAPDPFANYPNSYDFNDPMPSNIVPAAVVAAQTIPPEVPTVPATSINTQPPPEPAPQPPTQPPTQTNEQKPEEPTEQNNTNEAQKDPEQNNENNQDQDGSGSEASDDDQDDDQDEDNDENEEDEDDNDQEENSEDEGLEDIDEEPETENPEQNSQAPTTNEQAPQASQIKPENPIHKVEPSTDISFHDFYP